MNYLNYYCYNGIESCLDLFYHHIRFIIENCIPKILKQDFDNPKWFSKVLKMHKKQQKIAHY